MVGTSPERFGESLDDQQAIVKRLCVANSGWSADYALGYWHGMSDGANDNADGYYLWTSSMEPYACAYRAAHKLYNGRLIASRRYVSVLSDLPGVFMWKCSRCNRLAGSCEDKPQHHRCIPRL